MCMVQCSYFFPSFLQILQKLMLHCHEVIDKTVQFQSHSLGVSKPVKWDISFFVNQCLSESFLTLLQLSSHFSPSLSSLIFFWVFLCFSLIYCYYLLICLLVFCRIQKKRYKSSVWWKYMWFWHVLCWEGSFKRCCPIPTIKVICEYYIWSILPHE